MTYKLVRFIEDRLEVCLLTKIKENSEIPGTVLASYRGKYYPAVVLNEGSARTLRDTANVCGAAQPNLLRGTKLRKHIATVSQALNLTENELSILADYMGHNIDVHRHFYRLPNEAIHLAKISQLLFALDNDTINSYKGKTLEEINIEDLSIEDPDREDMGLDNAELEYNETMELEKIQENTRNIHDNFDSGADFEDNLIHTYSIGTNVQETEIQENTRITPEHFDSESYVDENLNHSNKSEWTPRRKRKKVPKIMWTTSKKYAIRKHFAKHLKNNYLPSSAEWREAIKKYSALRGRTFMQLKLWISNNLKKEKGKRRLTF